MIIMFNQSECNNKHRHWWHNLLLSISRVLIIYCFWCFHPSYGRYLAMLYLNLKRSIFAISVFEIIIELHYLSFSWLAPNPVISMLPALFQIHSTISIHVVTYVYAYVDTSIFLDVFYSVYIMLNLAPAIKII